MKPTRHAKVFYGIDAPYVIMGQLGAGVLLNLIFIGYYYHYWISKMFFTLSPLTYLGLSPAVQWWLYVPHLFVIPLWMFFSSLRGKYTQRDIMLDKVEWSGSETVLDVGCGRGLILIGAAQRLTTGKAYGIDIWSSQDLSHNSQQATLQNAQAEGVDDRVIVTSMDVCHMSFSDNMFDVVTASLVVHNINDVAGRRRALEEMLRVCKPGGMIIIQDFQYIDAYASCLRDIGAQHVNISKRYWRMFPPVRIITCTK